MCIRGGEQGAGVENVVKVGSGLGFFPLSEMTVSVMWRNSSGQINMKT